MWIESTHRADSSEVVGSSGLRSPPIPDAMEENKSLGKETTVRDEESVQERRDKVGRRRKRAVLFLSNQLEIEVFLFCCWLH